MWAPRARPRSSRPRSGTLPDRPRRARLRQRAVGGGARNRSEVKMGVVAVPGVVQYLLGPGSTWRDVGLASVDLAVVGFLIYRVLLLIRGTRAINVLVGLFLLGIGYLASQWANLVTLNWLLGHFLSYS